MSYSSVGTLELISDVNLISLNGAQVFQQILSGTSSVPSSGGATVTFSKAFNNVPIVVATGYGSSGTNFQMYLVTVTSITTTSFTIDGMYIDFDSGTKTQGTNFGWIAIG